MLKYLLNEYLSTWEGKAEWAHDLTGGLSVNGSDGSIGQCPIVHKAGMIGKTNEE